MPTKSTHYQVNGICERYKNSKKNDVLCGENEGISGDKTGISRIKTHNTSFFAVFYNSVSLTYPIYLIMRRFGRQTLTAPC